MSLIEFLNWSDHDAAVLGAGIGAAILAIVAGVRGWKRSTPLPPPPPPTDPTLARIEEKIDRQTRDLHRRCDEIEAEQKVIRDNTVDIKARLSRP